MELSSAFWVKLEPETYTFYNEIARVCNRPVEEILSDTLCKCAEMMRRGAEQSGDAGEPR